MRVRQAILLFLLMNMKIDVMFNVHTCTRMYMYMSCTRSRDTLYMHTHTCSHVGQITVDFSCPWKSLTITD